MSLPEHPEPEDVEPCPRCYGQGWYLRTVHRDGRDWDDQATECEMCETMTPEQAVQAHEEERK